MAQTLSKLSAIAEGMGEYREALADAWEAYNAPCGCCCCTGECSMSNDAWEAWGQYSVGVGASKIC